jgi:hypothetical protein
MNLQLIRNSDETNALTFCQSQPSGPNACDPKNLFATGYSMNITIPTLKDYSGSFYYGVNYIRKGMAVSDDAISISYFSPTIKLEKEDTASISSSPSPTTSTNSAVSSATQSNIGSVASPSSNGLSGGAKAGIAVGVVGGVLLVLLAAFFLWRRNRKHMAYDYPQGIPYSNQDLNSPDRNPHAEKELNIINNAVPYEPTGGHSDVANAPNAVHDRQHMESNSWMGAAGSEHTGNADLYHDIAPPRAPTPPPNHSQPPVLAQAAPPGVAAHHLHEPGMSPDDLAKLEEEERRLDEAIAEAERRRA